MEIQHEGINNKVKIADIKAGQTFLMLNSYNVYMKLFINDAFNAVNLANGNTLVVREHSPLILVKTRCVVKDGYYDRDY